MVTTSPAHRSSSSPARLSPAIPANSAASIRNCGWTRTESRAPANIRAASARSVRTRCACGVGLGSGRARPTRSARAASSSPCPVSSSSGSRAPSPSACAASRCSITAARRAAKTPERSRAPASSRRRSRCCCAAAMSRLFGAGGPADPCGTELPARSTASTRKPYEVPYRSRGSERGSTREVTCAPSIGWSGGASTTLSVCPSGPGGSTCTMVSPGRGADRLQPSHPAITSCT